MARILLIEHNLEWQNYVKKAIEPTHSLSHCPHGRALSSRLREKNYEIILFSLSKIEKQDSFNLNLLRQIKRISPSTPVIVISEVKEANIIVKAIKEIVN